MAVKGKTVSVLEDDDYITFDKLSVPLTDDVMQEDGSFTLCLWIYLLKTIKPGAILRQVCKDSDELKPFLSMDQSKRLIVYYPSCETEAIGVASEKTVDHGFVSTEQACPLEKWVHVGCEMGVAVTRIHIDGVIVGEKTSLPFSQNKQASRPISLVGAENCNGADNVQAYAHYVRVLPQPAVTNHYVKHPPLELSLDGSTGATDDHEVEEGGDGVWSVVGGKASCRRNFALDVVLLDALGRSIHKEMEIIALLVYADNGAPVEKPKDDAEAPLLTTFDGVEFPSTERPIKLVHGRASFKLKISQLSSKCDNRLFRVCFDSPNTPNYPFLRVFSRPIRCVSRNRNSRAPASVWKRTNPSLFPPDSARSPEEMIVDTPLTNGDHYANGNLSPPFTHASKLIAGQPQIKRTRIGPEKMSTALANGAIPPDHSSEICTVSNNFPTSDGMAAAISEPHKSTHPMPSFESGPSWHGNASIHNSQGPSTHVRQFNGTSGMDYSVKQETLHDGNPTMASADTEPTSYKPGISGGLSDFFVFKYGLENMYSRAAFLKGVVRFQSDQDLSDFAKRVSQYTGCHHNGYQILIAKKLILDGDEVWKQLSKELLPVPWSNMISRVEEHFMKICACTKRRFLARDREFLRQIALCGEGAFRDDFDRLWQWIYPVALSLSSPQVCMTWEIEEPKWIEGMISREEAEALLKTQAGSKPGTFTLRFASSRSWPHPDAGALVVSYVGHDLSIHHKLLSLDKSSGFSIGDKRPLSELLLSQTELSQPYR
eukprot:c23265_g1_i1 orf=395-2704(+)